jgi:hypothetical protein
LKDAFGNIIDGFHRKGENASWHELAVPHIDTPIKLELARLAVNFARRRVPPEELKQRIKFLMENGLKPDEIVSKTGIGKTTIYKYAPQELKDKMKVETGKMGGLASGEARETFGSLANQTFQTQNTQAEPADPAPAISEANAEPKDLSRGTETSTAAETKPAEIIQPTRPAQPAQPPIAQPPTFAADEKVEEAKRKAADEYKVEEAKRKGLVKKIVEFCPESVAKWTIDTFSWKNKKEEEFATFLTIIIDIEHSVLAKHNLLDEVKMEADKWK